METQAQNTARPPLPVPLRPRPRTVVLLGDVPDVMIKDSDGHLCGLVLDADDKIQVVRIETPF